MDGVVPIISSSSINRSMSHFIENTHNLESGPILKTVSKQIVIPPLRAFKHCQGGCDEGEQKMLKVMFFQLKNEEFQKIHEENTVEMRRQFQALKRKLALRAKQSNSQQTLHKGGPALPKLQLSQIIKMSPLKVDLLKKYRNKIHGKLSVFRQAEQISKDKEQYNQWYDSTKNSPLKSPIFNKMLYLLEKVDQGKENLRKTASPKDKKPSFH